MFSELKISPGVGISILIGAVGSVYLIVQSHRYFSKLSQRRRPEVKKSDVECHICNGNIDVDNTSSFATCRGCERMVCRNKDKQCCEWISAIGIWECQNCNSNRAIQRKAGEWLLNQLTIRLQNPGPVHLKNDALFGLDTSDLEDGPNSSCSVSSNQKIKVREFIEELLSSMLNGPLDDVSVGQLMKNENYLPLCEGQKVPDSPSDKHFELRKLVQRIIDEVTKLPEMLNHSGLPLRPEEHLPYFSPKKYEQLLATAVLNKVVEDYRNPKNFEDVAKKLEQSSLDAVSPTHNAVKTGSALNKDSLLDINHNNVSGTSLLNEVNIRQMSLNTDEKHSQEGLMQRSLSESDESYLSDYIQKHTVPLPDLSDTNGSGSGPEDDLVSLKSNITEGTSWEENWLFRKRQLKTTETAIAMLVPSPTEDVKALIGDQIVDDVSDLSEADVEDYDSDNNNESGDSNLTQSTLDDEIHDSLISVNPIPSNEPTLSEAKNSLLLAETLLSSLPPDGLVPELISIEHNSGKVEASNVTLLGENINHIENSKPNAVETDDVKLMQERNQNAPKQREHDANVLPPIDVERAINKDSQLTEYDRKEVPIDKEPHSSPIQESETDRSNNEILASIDDNLIPGSIAERDILKWRNASPIPNNPYSPDILQKRLSESNRRSNLVDFDRLTNKDNDVPTEIQPISISEGDAIDVQDQSLDVKLEGNQRYGRDYYINDAKQASGSRMLGTGNQSQISHSTDDEKSLLLTQKQSSNTSQRTSPAVSPSHRSDTNLQTGVFPFVKSSSCGNVIPTNKTEDIFSAGRPVQVAPTDPILRKGTKLEYLSTPAHEVYLIPANEPITPHSLESLSEQSIQSRADESLTLSEDSDITRIYEIGTGETKLIQGDAIQGVKVPTSTPPPTPDEHVSGHIEVDSNNDHNVTKADVAECTVVSEEILEIIPQTSRPSSVDPVPLNITPSSPTIDRSDLLKPRYVQVKQLSPDTIKFFAPKKTFSGSMSNLTTSAALSKSSSEIRELPINTCNHMHSSLHIDFPASRNVPAHEFIIEKEVMDVLPSVKELAKCYSGNNQRTDTTSKPIIKPTDFIRQSSDMLHDDQEARSGMPQVANKNRRMYNSTSSINAAEEIREIRRLNLEAYNRPTFVPMAPGHSITARSLSKQIRDELKTNATDDFKVQGGHISPERPSSPVFAPGHLRNSIQFFENLKEK
uniref:FYVE-type zinc finger domain-containing protein n=1 Tax=Culex tarsalis TaxID=7177 RepID=A0A1Q3FKB5_CULTA